MRTLFVAAAAALLTACITACATPQAAGASVPSSAPAAASAPAPLFVDSSAPSAGADGTRAHPYRTLREALAAARPPATIRLAVGLYPGAVIVPSGIRIEGPRTAVVYAEAGVTAVQLAGGAALSGITVQGGDVGVAIDNGLAEIDHVAFSGQRKIAIAVHATGELALNDADLEGTVSETRGVVLEAGARAQVTGGRFHGGLRIGVEVLTGAELRIDGTVFDGPVTALKAERAPVFARALRISGGRGAALSFAGTHATLRDIAIHGHEYGLLANAGTALDVRDLVTVRAERAGIGCVQVTGTIDGLIALDSGSFGAAQLISSKLTLRHFLVARAQSAGISVNGGDVTLIDGAIIDVRDRTDDEGDGLSVRHARVRATALTEARIAGAGIVAAEASRVAIAEAAIHSPRYGGLHAETAAQLDALSVDVRQSHTAALVVLHNARLRADVLQTQDNAQGLLWAECGAGAEVRLGRVRGPEAANVHAACLGAWVDPALLDPFAPQPE